MIKKRKLQLLFYILLMGCISLTKAGDLEGSLIDETEETIPFATVAVLKLPDSTVVGGATTNMDGEFKLKTPSPGDYILKFSSVGFKAVYSPQFTVTDATFSQDFGTITLETETTMLNEVMIKTWRPRVVMEGGNLDVKVDGTALAAGSSAYEVLTRTPGVSVDQNGELQLNGKSGVMVMIDGRRTFLSPAEMNTLLEGMSAENIESIEVINNPSAKYDAEGSSGILNIKLKKNTLTGLNGSVFGGFMYNGLANYNAGANMNYKSGDWNSFLNVDYRRSGRLREGYLSRGFAIDKTPIAFFEQESDEERIRVNPSVRLGTDYTLNDQHSFGVMADFSFRNTQSQWNTDGAFSDFETGETVNVLAENNQDEDFGTGRFNLHYNAALDTVGTNLSVNLDYVALNEESRPTFRNIFITNDGEDSNERLFTDNQSNYDIFSGQIDLTLPLNDNAKLEFGLKGSDVVSESQLDFYIEENGEGVLDPSRSNHFKYEERIYASYGSFSNRFNDTWKLTAGLRVEQTVANGVSATMGQTIERDYLEFFPSVSLDQKVSDNYSLNYAYNRRILRPDYENLNPFIFYLDPYTYVEGNPDLRPQFTNTFQLTQVFFKKYNLMLGYDVAQDFIGEVPMQDPVTRETAFSINNLDEYTNLSATLIVPVQISSWWNMTNTAVVANQKYATNVEGIQIENEQLFYMVQSMHRLKLPGEIDMEMNANYRGPVAYGLYHIDQQFGLDLGFKKSFMQDRLDVTLSIDDLFRSRQIVGKSNVYGNTTAVDQYLGNQNIGLSMRYRLGGEQKGTQRAQNELEELNRAGGK